jgi:DNA-binding transcriptional MocR family regulator
VVSIRKKRSSRRRKRENTSQSHFPSRFKLNGISDSRELIQRDAVHKKVILVPGNAFDPTNKNGQDVPNPNPYVRASFSTASFEDGEEAFKRFGELIKEAQLKK